MVNLFPMMRRLLLALMMVLLPVLAQAQVFTDRLDGIVTGQAIKNPVQAATTANITLSGLQAIDGYQTVQNDRVLVKNQTDLTLNGIYNASTANWTRTTDFDGYRDATQGTLVYVVGGSTNGTTFWQLVSSDNPPTFGYSNLTFVEPQFQISSTIPGVTWASISGVPAPVTAVENGGSIQMTAVSASSYISASHLYGATISGTLYGDGSNLTGLPGSASPTWAGIINKPQVITDISNSTGSVSITTLTASSYVSTALVSATSVNVAGAITATTTMSAARLNVTNISATTNVQANKFIGDGSLLTGINTAGGQPHKSVFTSSGTFTTSGNITTATVFKITITGGGSDGSAGSASAVGSGGNCGGTTIVWLSGLSPSTAYTVTVGSAGGNSSIVIGGVTYAAAGGGNSVTTNGTISITPQGGDGGGTVGGGISGIGASGAKSIWGSGYGAGGQGGGTNGSTGTSGAAGHAGIIVIEWLE